MKGIIDRFEGDFVIIEKDDQTFIEIERKMFQDEIQEGDSVDLNTYRLIKNDANSANKERLQRLSTR